MRATTVKEASLTIRIDPQLRDDFNSLADVLGRPAAQIIRELMQGYVEDHKQPVQAQNSLSEEERFKREYAVMRAHTSVAHEGLFVPEEEKEWAKRFIAGEITLDEYIDG